MIFGEELLENFTPCKVSVERKMSYAPDDDDDDEHLLSDFESCEENGASLFTRPLSCVYG